MLKLFPLLAALALLMGFAPSPTEVDSVQDPVVWSQVNDDGVVLALQQSGTLTASTVVEAEGVFVTSTTASPPADGDPVPSLSTTYTDTSGSVHTITTPIPSTTPAGLASAMTTHKTLVALMKQNFPPAP